MNITDALCKEKFNFYEREELRVRFEKAKCIYECRTCDPISSSLGKYIGFYFDESTFYESSDYGVVDGYICVPGILRQVHPATKDTPAKYYIQYEKPMYLQERDLECILKQTVDAYKLEREFFSQTFLNHFAKGY